MISDDFLSCFARVNEIEDPIEPRIGDQSDPRL
jgi:hypothetical protein